MSNFNLGRKSRRELEMVYPPLVTVVQRAIQITKSDFTVFDGIRTAKEQNYHYRNGKSQRDGYRKKSLHQLHDVPAGARHAGEQYGMAVDLVPWIDSRPQWLWPEIYDIANAMIKACQELNASVVWGGSWTNLLDAEPGSAKKIQQAYVSRRVAQGKRAFPDGPHYEWRF